MTYQNFYMKDIRTPETYYENQEGSKEQSLERLKGKLDDLLAALDALKERSKQPTPAYKKILDYEVSSIYVSISWKNSANSQPISCRLRTPHSAGAHCPAQRNEELVKGRGHYKMVICFFSRKLSETISHVLCSFSELLDPILINCAPQNS